MLEPVTIGLIIWSVISLFLHIKSSKCSFNRWGFNCDCLATETEKKSCVILDVTSSSNLV